MAERLTFASRVDGWLATLVLMAGFVSVIGNWLSGPALSLDRLRIDYGRGRSLLVSPKERERFVSELSKPVALSRASKR